MLTEQQLSAALDTALETARRGHRGANPLVGACVLDASGSLITTGFHALHVTGGLVAFLLTLGRAFAVKNFTHKEATTAIVVSYYWHFVDVVWIVLFFVIYFLK